MWKKNLTLTKVTSLSSKKKILKIGTFSAFRKKAKYTKYLTYAFISVK